MSGTSEIIFAAEEEEKKQLLNIERSLMAHPPPTNTSLHPDIAVVLVEPRPSVMVKEEEKQQEDKEEEEEERSDMGNRQRSGSITAPGVHLAARCGVTAYQQHHPSVLQSSGFLSPFWGCNANVRRQTPPDVREDFTKCIRKKRENV